MRGMKLLDGDTQKCTLSELDNLSNTQTMT